MGVTLSRAAIKGGAYYLDDVQTLFLKPIGHRVRNYIGIAGANYGSTLCNLDFFKQNFDICDNVIGFYPGDLDNCTNKVVGLSKFLKRLNCNPFREGTHTYAMFSIYD